MEKKKTEYEKIDWSKITKPITVKWNMECPEDINTPEYTAWCILQNHKIDYEFKPYKFNATTIYPENWEGEKPFIPTEEMIAKMNPDIIKFRKRKITKPITLEWDAECPEDVNTPEYTAWRYLQVDRKNYEFGTRMNKIKESEEELKKNEKWFPNLRNTEFKPYKSKTITVYPKNWKGEKVFIPKEENKNE